MIRNSLKHYGLFPIIGLYILFASTFSIGKHALFYGPSALFVGLRMFFAGLILLFYAYLSNKKSLFIRKTDFWSLASTAFFGIFITYVPEYWALRYVSIAKMAFFCTLTPFFTALCGYIRGSEILTKKKLLGLFIGFCGLLPILIANLQHAAIDSNIILHGGCLSIYDIVILLSVIFYSYNWLIIKDLLHIGKYSSVVINGWSMLGGGILSLLWSFLREDWIHWYLPRVTEWLPFLGYTALITVVGTGCYMLYSKLLNIYTATLIAFVGFIEPLFGMAYGILFHNESLNFEFIYATIIIAIGLSIFYKDELQQ